MFFVTLAAISSCAMNEDMQELPMPDVYIDFGVISAVGEDDYFEIRGDDNQLFQVVEYGTPDYKVTLNDRVQFNYSVISEDKANNTFRIRVNGFNNIVSNAVLPLSFVDSETADGSMLRRDSLGNDGIRVSDITLQGKYINIVYEILVTLDARETERIINLIYNDYEDDKDNTLMLILCHNAYGVVPGAGIELSSSKGNTASFEIASLVPDKYEEVRLSLNWYWYGTQSDELIEETLDAVYKLPDWVRR